MRLLVRHRLRRTRREGYVERSEILEADSIRIGRGSDSELHLTDGRVLLHHATISLENSALVVTADPPAEIEHDGIVVAQAELTPGHIIAIGPYDITCGETEDGCDAAIGVELARPMGDAESALRERVRTPLLGRRRSGWKIGGAIALVLLLLGVGLPLSTFIQSPSPEVVSGNTDTDQDILRMAETLWVTERLSRVHDNLEAGCQACHVAPFAAVTESTCLECHNTLTAHIDPHASFGADVNMEDGCASCHQEHIGPDGILPGVAVTETGCIACHNGDIDPGDGRSLAKVASIAEHPPFTLPTPPDSGLKFSHASHLVPQGKRGPDGARQVLGCVDCHQSVNAGADMTLPSFESGCRSCHTLAFAAEDPNRRLPHGSVWTVQDEVEDFYAAVERGDIVAPKTEAPPRRRRPGQSAAPRSFAPPEPVPAAQRAAAALSGPAVKGQCATCHVLDEGTQVADWDIAPVDAVHTWLSSAHFSHKDHEGEAGCASCHAVGKSEKVSDVAMPSMGTCLDCHGSAADFPEVDSTCVSCHAFHGTVGQGASVDAPQWFADTAGMGKTENSADQVLADILKNTRF
jgi:hypothetical protein